jgi:hypothetical protein
MYYCSRYLDALDVAARHLPDLHCLVGLLTKPQAAGVRGGWRAARRSGTENWQKPRLPAAGRAGMVLQPPAAGEAGRRVQEERSHHADCPEWQPCPHA